MCIKNLINNLIEANDIIDEQTIATELTLILKENVNPNTEISTGHFAGTTILWWAIRVSRTDPTPLNLIQNKSTLNIEVTAPDGMSIIWMAIKFLVADYSEHAYKFIMKQSLTKDIIHFSSSPKEFKGQNMVWLAMHAIATYHSAGRFVLDFLRKISITKHELLLNEFPQEQSYHGLSLVWLAFKALATKDANGIRFLNSIDLTSDDINFDVFPRYGEYQNQSYLLLALQATHEGYPEGLVLLLRLDPTLRCLCTNIENRGAEVLEFALKVISKDKINQVTELKLCSVLANTPLHLLLNISNKNLVDRIETSCIENDMDDEFNEFIFLQELKLSTINLSVTSKLALLLSLQFSVQSLTLNPKRAQLLSNIHRLQEELISKLPQPMKPLKLIFTHLPAHEFN